MRVSTHVHSDTESPWTGEEIESVPLNLGKCKKLKNTPKLRMQKRGDREKCRLKKGNS